MPRASKRMNQKIFLYLPCLFNSQNASWTHALREIVVNCYKYHGREDLLPRFTEEDDDQKKIHPLKRVRSSHFTISPQGANYNYPHIACSLTQDSADRLPVNFPRLPCGFSVLWIQIQSHLRIIGSPGSRSVKVSGSSHLKSDLKFKNLEYFYIFKFCWNFINFLNQF